MGQRRLAIALLAVLLAGCTGAASKLVGTEITPTAAADFTLVDGITGRPTTLSAQQGKVVVLAFLYTHCPDVCPLTAEQFRQVQQKLTADELGRTLFVAVSVDPVRDTPQAVQAFATDHGLAKDFVYLIGSAAQLQAVWSAYGIRIETDPTTPAVGHSDAIYLFDRKGRVRLLVHSNIAAADLANNVKVLNAER